MAPPQSPVPWLERVVVRATRRRRRGTVAPRLASSAVRIPDARLDLPLRFRTTGPQIFVHEGARQALERRLCTAFGGPVQLAVTDNRRNMITHSKTRGLQRVRVHMMFLDAPDRVTDALIGFVVRGDREASQILGEYIDGNSHRLRPSHAFSGTLKPQGTHHDLGQILASVDETYFGSACGDVLITWGRRTRPRSQQRATIQLGSYSAAERLIRIHPTLDRKWVPRYFVAHVVYHELLHHVIPAVRVGGRALLHTPEFQQREREYRHYERAIRWERANIGRLLRL